MQDHRSIVRYQGLITASLRLIQPLKNIILLCLIAEVLLNCFNIITAFDFPWQLAEGEFILSHGYPAHSVLKAYGEISPQFANEYIPYEILIAVINHVTGRIGLCLFFALLAFLIYAPCLQLFIRSRGHYYLLAFGAFLLAQWIINPRIIARPELAADICYMAEVTMLLRNSTRSWSGYQLVCLGLVFFIWSNIHGTFLLGLIMLMLWYAQLFIINWQSHFFIKEIAWIGPGVAALLGCAINPFGLARFTQPFKLHSLLWGQATSFEMWPVTIDAIGPSVTGASIGLIVLAMRARDRKSYWLMVMLLLLQYLTFTSNRYSIFIGLILLVALKDVMSNVNLSPLVHSLPRALGRLMGIFFLTILFILFTTCLFYVKVKFTHYRARYFYPESPVATNSSFVWLIEHRAKNYIMLSHIDAGSWAQMPGDNGIYPLMDSGTHRYSDQVNQLYYYSLFSANTLQAILAKLNINAIILGDVTIYWAPTLNESPEWSLTHIDIDSQLYLRSDKPDVEAERKLFTEWEQNVSLNSPDYIKYSYKTFIRGLNLRPDDESLRILEAIPNAVWMYDPQIVYLQNWLAGVSDDRVKEAVNNLGDKKDSRSVALRIIFALRMKQYKQADEIAQQWNPSVLEEGSQSMQEIRAQAFLSVGDNQGARKILQSLWPEPRYSLRWARLCGQAYADDAKDMPINARSLIGLDENTEWQKNTISTLNRNILGLLTQAALRKR